LIGKSKKGNQVGATERIVRHLKVRADSEAHVRHAVLTLEDAMRCASLPDAGARLLLVRRLDLGVVAQGISSQTLSRLVEEKVAAVGGAWVHAFDPAAERANFVFFRDALEARCELALRLARTTPCTAWYWRLAVPEFKPAVGAPANLRRIALTIAALPEAPVALPAWIARLTAAGAASVIARAIGPVDAAVLLHSAHLSDTLDAQKFQGTREVQPQPLFARQHGHPAELSIQTERLPAFATQPSWLQKLSRAGGGVLFTESSKRVAPLTRTTRLAASAELMQPGRSQASGEIDTPSTCATTESSETDLHAAQLPRQRHNISSEVALGITANTPAIDVRLAPLSDQFNTDAVCKPDQPDRTHHEAVPAPVLNGSPLPDASPTAYGGLLFLLPVLQRLGYPAWAETLPEKAAAHVVQHMLTLVLRRLDAPTDDPAWLLAGSSLSDPFGRIDVKAPAPWGDPTLAAPRCAAARDVDTLANQAQSVAALAHVVLIACRRWLRRVAGIGLASLVTRPAAIGFSATHADAFFRLGDADVRVRRAGLDFDLGWVPWYGRVISFHYTEPFTSVATLRTRGAPGGS
jgi:hypothetical protein